MVTPCALSFSDISKFYNNNQILSEFINKFQLNDTIFSLDTVEEIYNNIHNVRPSIETNYSFVEINGGEEYERNFYIQYTNEYQKFEFIPGTLIIKAKDRNGNSIKIHITAEWCYY